MEIMIKNALHSKHLLLLFKRKVQKDSSNFYKKGAGELAQ